MEDLYSNLDNYDDVNAVDELKNENRELKLKLEECSKTMNQLQKDFDKLNSEYKKLEINYSSLLKTARAEIERKTQLITNLNKEKDMIVIKAMQGGCRSILKNLNKPAHNFNKNDVKPKCEENKDILDKNRASLSGGSREGSRESPMLLMKDNSIAPSTNRSSSSEHNLRQLDDGYKKENMLKSTQNQKHNIDKPKSMKISDRRKSMPVFSNGEEPTSEEDIAKDDCTNTRERYKYQDYDNDSHNLQYMGSKGGQRTSRFEQYSREPTQMYNRGKDRYNPHFDKYKSYNQNYDNYSPERGRQWQQRGNDYSHRSEHYRQRELGSPPRNKYGRSKSRDRRHRDNNRWDRYEENYDAGNIREPDLKRRRMDSGNSEWERRDQAVERMSYRPSEYRPDVASGDHGSCQSPDYDQIESNLNHHSIKEIKNTATVQLEDPRINSNKYSLKESERGVYIATVDKNVDIIPVDKTLWGFEKVEVPEALKTNVWKEPASEDIVNYIYTDIDDPAIISSTKCSKDEDIAIPETLRNPGGQNVCRKEHSTSDITEQKSQKTNVTAFKSIPNDYKIPKKSTTDKKSITSVQEKLIKKDYNYSNKNVILSKDSHVSKKEVFEDKNKLKTQPKLAPVQHNVEGDLELSDEASDDELQITCKQNDKLTLVSDNENDRDDGSREKDIKQNDKPQIKDIMTITEDNNGLTRKKNSKDHISGNTEPIKASIENNEKIQVHADKKKLCHEEASNKKLESCKKKTSKKKHDGKTPENKDVKIIEKTNQSPEIEAKEKKKREKRKRLSSKETVQEKQESKVAHTNTGDDDDKPTGSKPHNKFTELFGDSSSLITPEDLNLPTKFEINVERNDNNYASLFENTQDAIDINVREIKEVSKTGNSNKEVLANVEALEIEEDPQKTLNKKSLFEINDDHPVANMFENLKPANIDDELGIVKTVVISTGTQPCIKENNKKQRNTTEDEPNNIKTVVIPTTHTGIRPCMDEKNTNQTNLTVVDSNQAKETEEVVKQQPLAIPKFDSLQLKAVATSTPNKMQHDLPVATTSVPNDDNLNNDSNISYSASLATTNVEANSDAPDVRIFIKRRRKIKKV
ncbi:uncharacterized protein LOC121731346 isoform X2 [Aricia agestis]|uniref:uncharacterized protein LOC121731346 isoform X2 n=1 Tax=Aricia agestis TaxID=91739 RepID=UPI001C205115|nr:uncharacterized protein LOC121731346 isoform X2 [Aricia agestis]